MRKMYVLYQTTNLINGKFYRGVHQTHNLDDGYTGSGTLLKRAINKYGPENFRTHLIGVADCSEALFRLEANIVNDAFIKRDDTYNIKLGGYGGWDHIKGNQTALKKRVKRYTATIKDLSKDPEWCARRSKHIGDALTAGYRDGHRLKIHTLPAYLTFKGRHHSEESKKKIGAVTAIAQMGSGNSQYGTCWIYNPILKISKKVPKVTLEQPLEAGWLRGRKLKF